MAICGCRLPIFDPILLPLDRLTLGRSEEFHRAADHVAGPGDQRRMIGVMAEENQWWDQDHITTVIIIYMILYT